MGTTSCTSAQQGGCEFRSYFSSGVFARVLQKCLKEREERHPSPPRSLRTPQPKATGLRGPPGGLKLSVNSRSSKTHPGKVPKRVNKRSPQSKIPPKFKTPPKLKISPKLKRNQPTSKYKNRALKPVQMRRVQKPLPKKETP